MLKIDTIDRKILYHLFLNARQSHSALAKKIHSSKHVVTYRIKRLEENNVIQGYRTIVDGYRLGLTSYRFYFSFQRITPQKKNEILEYLIQWPTTYYVGITQGVYSVQAVLGVQNTQELQKFYIAFMAKFGEYILHVDFQLHCRAIHYPRSYLIKNGKREVISSYGGKKDESIDKTDLKLLKVLGEDARASVSKICQQVNATPQTIVQRIKRLQKKGVIQAFRARVNNAELGIITFKLNIYVHDRKKLSAIKTYLAQNPHVVAFYETIAYADIEVEVDVPNFKYFEGILTALTTSFGSYITKYNYVSELKTLKSKYVVD